MTYLITDRGICDKSRMEPQNKNNNAYTDAANNKKNHTNTKDLFKSEQQNETLANNFVCNRKDEKIKQKKMKDMSLVDTNGVKGDEQILTVNTNDEVRENSKNAEILRDPLRSNAQSLLRPPTSQKSVSTEKDEQMRGVYPTSHGKITHNATSRFGMKTFTVIPPKPSVTRAAVEKSSVPFTIGAIKIDDQGNMVKAGISRNNVTRPSELKIISDEDSPLLGKAKAFWSSNERQDSAENPSKDLNDSVKESTNNLKSASTSVTGTTLKSSNTEYLKSIQSTVSKPAERIQPKEVVTEETKEPLKDVKVADKHWVEVDTKISGSRNVQQPSDTPTLPPSVLPDFKKDLSFLRPPRRTSSQYVASAITKHAPKTSAKPSCTTKSLECSTSAKTPTADFQKSGRSIQVNPHQSSLPSLSDNKENVSSSIVRSPGPQSSTSYPQYMLDSQKDFGEPNRIGPENGIRTMLETEAAKNNHTESSRATKIKVTANNQDNIKHIRPRNPSPAKSNALNSNIKPPTAPKIIFHGQTSVSKIWINIAIY